MDASATSAATAMSLCMRWFVKATPKRGSAIVLLVEKRLVG